MNCVLKLALLFFMLTEEETGGGHVHVRAEKVAHLEANRELEHSSNSNKLTITAASVVKEHDFQYKPLHMSILDEGSATKWQNQMAKLIVLRKRKRRKMWKMQHQWPSVIRNRRSLGIGGSFINNSDDMRNENSSKETDLVKNRLVYLNRPVLKDPSIALGCSSNCSNSEQITNGCVKDCYPKGENKALCHKCSQVCHSVAGTPSKCGCYRGYAIGTDWQHCIDVDECSLNPWLCHGGTCLNTVGSFLCRCQPGYHLIGHTCVDVNECSTTTGEQVPCHQLCINVPGTYQCWCHKGYVPSANSSRTCIDINECKQRVCTHDCLNTVGSFICKCPPNMLLHSNRRTCVPMTPGTFSVPFGMSNSSLIIERSGAMGFKKQTNDYPSATIHLINLMDVKSTNHSMEEIGQSGSGTSGNASAAYSSPPRVYISDGNRGVKQEDPKLHSNWRKTVPSKGSQARSLCIPACRNGGVCGENRKCNCRSGFQGYYCQIDVNECLRAPPVCGRFICVNSIGSYQCLCPAGYIQSLDKNICVVVNSLLIKPKSLSINDTVHNETVREGTDIEFVVSHAENTNLYAPSEVKLHGDNLYTTEVTKSRILKSETPNDTQSVLPDTKVDKDSASVLDKITGSEESIYRHYFNATSVPTPSLESTLLSSFSTNSQNLDLHHLNNKQISELIQNTSTVNITSDLHSLFSFILGPNSQKQNNFDTSQLKMTDQSMKSAVFATPVLSRKSDSGFQDEITLGPNYANPSRVHSNVTDVSGSFTVHSNETRRNITIVAPEIQNFTSGYSEEYDADDTKKLSKLKYTNNRKHSRRNKQKHVGEIFIDERRSQSLARESQKQTGGRKFKNNRKQLVKLIKDFHVLSQMLEDSEEPEKLQTKCTGNAGGKRSNHTSRDGELCVEVLGNEDDDNPANIGGTTFHKTYPKAPAPLYAPSQQQMKGVALSGSKEEHCSYKNKKIQSRMTYWDEKNCTKCLCKNGTLRCRSYHIAADCCKHSQNTICCEYNPIDCLVNNEVYLAGEKFVPPLDPCRECHCKNGEVQCNSVTCVVNCHHPQIIPGECCPVCEGCHHFNQRFEDQETFPHPSDSCKLCQCQSGNVTCSPKPCTTKCSHPYKSGHDCCPLCRHCYFNGRKISNGASVMTNNGTCQKCTCKQGSLTCKNAPCERSCIIRGKTLPSGAEFHIGSDSCTQCHCWNGSVSCHAVECQTTCSHGVLLPNRCCLDCSKCDYKGELYTENEEFQSKEDFCKRCRCTKGNVSCREMCSLAPIH